MAIKEFFAQIGNYIHNFTIIYNYYAINLLNLNDMIQQLCYITNFALTTYNDLIKLSTLTLTLIAKEMKSQDALP